MIFRPRLTFLKLLLSLILFQLLSARVALAEELASDDTALAERIYYGVEVPELNIPVALLAITDINGRFSACSGVVLNKDTILTAAHCLNHSPLASIIVKAGGYAANGIFYRHLNSPYDLGYVKLDRKLPRSVKAAKLSKKYPAYGEEIYLLGYGYDEYGNIGKLRFGAMSTSGFDGIQITAVRPFNGSSACQGDSGGPAFVLRKKKLQLVGITSTVGVGCQTFANFIATLTPTAKSFIKLAKKKLKKR